MSDQPTQILATQKDGVINRIQRFFEDWWPIFVVTAAVMITIGYLDWVWGLPGDQDMTYCTARHGHVVRTGIGDQVACVDDTWRLETP